MSDEYYPSGPFLRKLAQGDEFDVAQEDFLLECRSERTARSYKTDLEDLREWCSERNVDPLNPSPSTVLQYLDGLAERDFSPGTIGRKKAALRGFYDRLVATGRLASSPFPARATRPKS